MIVQLLVLALGFIFLVKGADWFVDGAAGIAAKLHIPQLIIGLTIVAMGTSMPEAAVSIRSALNHSSGISIGNVVGSNIMNILVILGISSVITRISVQKSTLYIELPFVIAVTVLLLFFGKTDGMITFGEGVVFWGLFALYLGYLFVMARNSSGEDGDEQVEMPAWKCLLYVIIGGLLVIKGSDFAVHSAIYIAKSVGISDRLIGLTIVAFGTSLPELVTSVTAARKGDAGIAIGNIVGSNIFNILFVIGSTALIFDIPFASQFLTDTGIAIASAVLLFIGAVRQHALNRSCGVMMLSGFAIYFANLCF